MMARSIFFILIASLSGCLSGWAHADHFAVLAFGDSITNGYKTNCSGPLWHTNSYCSYLEGQFSLRSSHTASVYKNGKDGELSSEGVNRIGSVLGSGWADFILIMEGANDWYHGVSSGTVKANLSIMVDRSRNVGVTPVLGTVTPVQYGILPTTINAAIQQLASEKHVLLADQGTAIHSNWPSYTLCDGLHLKDSGDAKLAETWMNALLNDHRVSVSAPSVTTGSATRVMPTSARLTGQVNPNGEATTYWFAYGETEDYTNETSRMDAGVGTDTISVSASVAELLPVTTYHFKLMATSIGGTVSGTDMTLKTPAVIVPVITPLLMVDE